MPSPTTRRLCAAAQTSDIDVVVGLAGRDGATRGSLPRTDIYERRIDGRTVFGKPPVYRKGWRTGFRDEGSDRPIAAPLLEQRGCSQPLQPQASRGMAPSDQATADLRANAHSDQSSERAETRWSMSASVCTGEGVMRRRSVPFGTVG